MSSCKTKGIVLHTVRYGDSSSIVYMLTDTLGRRGFMVQGARGGSGKGNKSALLQPMFPVGFEAVRTRHAEMYRLRELVVCETLTSIPFDIRKSTIALFMAETLYRLVRESESDPMLFDFVWRAVRELDAMGEGTANFHLWFLVRLSGYLGFHPGNEYTPGARFDIGEGLFVRIPAAHGTALSQRGSELLAQLLECGVGELGSIALSHGARSEFLTEVVAYFGHHLDSIHNIRSIQIFKELF